MRLALSALLAAVFFLPTLQAADEKETISGGDAPPTAEESARQDWLHTTREGVRGSAYWLVRNVDGWFGDKPFEESGGEVSGAVRLRGLYREDKGFRGNVRFRLDVRMPNVDEKAYLFIGRDNEQELISDQQDTFSRSQLLLPEDRSADQTFFAGVGYHLLDNVDLRVGVRGGYKLYAQARYRKDWWLTERSNLEFRETLFIAVSDGIGATTSLNYAYAFNEKRAFRWRNSATLSTKTDGIGWSTAMGVFQAFGDQREVSLELLANGETDRKVGLREYGLRGIYSQPVYRDWLFGEIIAGYFWPRDDDDPERRKAWAFGLGVEMLF